MLKQIRKTAAENNRQRELALVMALVNGLNAATRWP